MLAESLIKNVTGAQLMKWRVLKSNRTNQAARRLPGEFLVVCSEPCSVYSIKNHHRYLTKWTTVLLGIS
jgi:hypothetical protein